MTGADAAGPDSLAARAAPLLVDVPDFPKPGVLFKDLTPLLLDPVVFGEVADWLATSCGPVDAVVGIESRGFLLGAPAAVRSGLPFVTVRKAGKLPRPVFEESYSLEYGTATLAIHQDALPAGARVVLIDDVLATGGTAAAACRLVERAGGVVAGVAVLLELTVLGGRAAVGGRPVHALLSG